MRQFAINKHWKQLLAVCLTSGLTYNVANALTLPDGPLATTTTSEVQPNVMLLMDNSGSMKNIMWHGDFDLMTDYGSWGSWSADGNKKYSDLTIDANGYLSGTKPGTGVSYSIKIPAPHAGATSYKGNYLNFLFWYADTNSLFDPSTRKADLTTDASGIPQNSRMGAAKAVATNVVTNNANMRFGLFKFNGGSGGTLVQECGADKNAVTTSINALTPDSTTPLAETYLDIIKYFRGDGFTSPIQYRCQKNFAIVVTDGYPTSDSTFPLTYAGATLPDYDGISTWDSAVNSFPDNVPHFSDGFGGGDDSSAGATLYLDDLAKLGFDLDLKTASNDLDGVSFDAPDFPKQNLVAHTVGLATASNMLDDAAFYTGGTYNSTATEAGLSTAIEAALDSFSSSKIVRSISNLSANSTALTGDTNIFQASYQASGDDWTGSLTATPIGVTSGAITTDTPVAFTIPATRYIYSLNGASTVAFTDSSLSVNQKDDICVPACAGTDTAATRISYLRGVTSGEVANGGSYRNRSSLLGDIINSTSTYVGAPAYRYTANDYQGFKSTNSGRAGVLYVGANDGMLHAFNTSSHAEIMAYVPNAVIANLGALTQPGYSHKYYVDGSPTTGDAYYDGAWHTVLVTGLNKGGRAIVGMDVTDPTSFSTSLSAWEFSDTDSADLGYTYSQPAIVQMADGNWAAVFGNGYDSATGKAVLYIGNLGATGLTSVTRIDTGAGDTATPNGLATVAPVDLNGDNKIDVIYAGDLYGKLWKFNVSSSSPGDWSVSNLFSACATQPCSQAITVRPEVGRGPKTGTVMVYFGTGKLLENTDPADTSLQNFYGIIDTLGNTTAVTKASLVAQTILEQYSGFYDQDGVLESSGAYRITSANAVNYGGGTPDKGWYMDLQYNGEALGERVVNNPILRNGRIIFTTNYYSTHVEDSDYVPGGGGGGAGGGGGTPLVCQAGNDVEINGESWIMELNALTGSRLAYSPFDTNNNATIDATDFVSDSSGNQVAVSGKKVGKNIGEPLILTYGDKEVVVSAKGENPNDGEILDKTLGNGGPGNNGIQGWVQIK